MTDFSRQAEPELMDLPHEAEAYAAADFSEVNARFTAALAAAAAPLGDSVRLCDLGCGPADIVVRIAQARPQWKLVAVDAAPAMLELAKKAVTAAGVGPRVDLVLADAKDTGLPGGFDVVCSNSILHHVADPLAFWRETRRLLRPGGLAFHRDLMRPESASAIRQLVATHTGKESETLQEEFHRSLRAAYRPNEIEAQLKAAGLSTLKIVVVSDRHLDVVGFVP